MQCVSPQLLPVRKLGFTSLADLANLALVDHYHVLVKAPLLAENSPGTLGSCMLWSTSGTINYINNIINLHHLIITCILSIIASVDITNTGYICNPFRNMYSLWYVSLTFEYIARALQIVGESACRIHVNDLLKLLWVGCIMRSDQRDRTESNLRST